MGHNLAKSDDMIYANYEKPWHGLGVPCDGLFTSADALEKADLDFSVVKKPIYRQVINVDGGTGIGTEFVEIPDRFETVRTDTDKNLGVVGNYYEPFQNSDAFGFLDSLVKEGEMMYDTAGALFGGKKVWMLVKLPDYVNVAGDPVEKFLLCVNSHDGSTPIMLKFTPMRVVCWNTLSGALGNWKQDVMTIKVRHTNGAGGKMEEAARILGISTAYYKNIEKIYGEMANFKVNKKLLEKYYKVVVPDPIKKQFQYDEKTGMIIGEEEIAGNANRAEKTREQLVQIFEESPSIKGTSAEGNMWGAFNSVTEYIQYHKIVPYENEKEGQRFNITVVDSNSGAQVMRNKAFSTAVNLVSKN